MIAYPGYHGVEDYEPCREILEGIYDVVMRYEGSEVNRIIISGVQKVNFDHAHLTIKIAWLFPRKISFMMNAYFLLA